MFGSTIHFTVKKVKKKKKMKGYAGDGMQKTEEVIDTKIDWKGPNQFLPAAKRQVLLLATSILQIVSILAFASGTIFPR